MLKVGAAAVLFCGLIYGSAQAAPMAGVNPELYPSQHAQSSTASAGANDVLKGVGGSSNEVSDAALKDMSGGSAPIFVLGDAQLNATNANPTTSNVSNTNVNTGAIGNQTLSNVTGVTTIMQNTGNGVTMQSINNVNITLK